MDNISKHVLKRVLFVVLILIIGLVLFMIGSMVGYSVIGEGKATDVFHQSVWQHILEFMK
ncbi:DNA-directed RNA polymerase subunit beta [Vagococcus humatus]|uniref:DNA-directed RNA polymerase subunit beta n=1 Tax=Vagococcus humatus TaxID=1889241 RepID=A0A429Z8Z6_9ENTE|nr:DNA-directed RNA polymerase subunit beta [Vagococcus humatus]RST90146.1 DNA-directed RNA polymerase subunit beta [Vagococcus humatus]